MPTAQNIVGPKLKVLRREKGLTQAMLAARCGLLGWDASENIVTKIETQVRCITDAELACLAKALDADVAEFLPPREKLKAVVTSFFSQ